MARTTQKVLILGGGFGGIKTALQLAPHHEFQTTLISDQTHFRYYPSLYRTATGGNQAASIIPLKEIFEAKPVHLVLDTASSLDRQKKIVQGASGEKYAYDVLIISLGSVTNFFGITGLKKYAYGIKSMDEARRLRNHLHQELIDEQKPDLNYVIIGGGSTGVELAAALPDYIRHIMRRHGLRERPLHIDLVEAAPRLMPRMPRLYSAAIARQLRKLGVKLYLGQAVQSVTADELIASNHEFKSHTVIWTAGVTNNPFFKKNDFSQTEEGRVQVDQFLQAETDIFVIGDNAETLYSGMAQTALHNAIFVVDNLKRRAQGRSFKSYKPKRPVYITPAGGRWAAVLWGRLQVYGFVGWLLRGAADFVAYHDLEPWWKASRHWLARGRNEEACPLCLRKS